MGVPQETEGDDVVARPSWASTRTRVRGVGRFTSRLHAGVGDLVLKEAHQMDLQFRAIQAATRHQSLYMIFRIAAR